MFGLRVECHLKYCLSRRGVTEYDVHLSLTSRRGDIEVVVSERGPTFSFVGGLVTLFFLWGFAWGFLSGEYDAFPHGTASDIMRYVTQSFSGSGNHIYEARYDRSGARSLSPDDTTPGVTLLTSYWRDEDGIGPEIRLMSHDGEMLHRWDVRPSKIWPTSPHDDMARGSKNIPSNYVHGTHLVEDGDIVFNVEYLGLVRMDACGEIEWKLPYRTHHSVSLGPDGHYWVVGQKWVEEGDDYKLSALDPPFVEDTILKVSPEGDVVREISLLDVLRRSGLQDLLTKYNRSSGDLLHTNDADVLSPERAEAFETLEAGDIVVSMKFIDTVLVLDGKSEEAKFHIHAPLIAQHDPDFLPSGRISIFNNRGCFREKGCDPWGETYGGSEIMTVDPSDLDSQEVIYRGDEKHPFYTKAGGKHQHLADGNVLITESRAGRVFEVTPEGELVWEWIHPGWNGERVPEVLEGTRYPFSPERIEQWNCN